MMFVHYESVSWAVFNSTNYDYRLGRKAVLDKFGERGWEKVKKMIREGQGIMAIFHRSPVAESKLFANVVGMSAERRAEKGCT